MPGSPTEKRGDRWLPIQADPPPWDVPLDETMADIHFLGDVKGKYDGPEGLRRLLEEEEDQSWSARLKRFLGLR